jgi:8-oxo-dGTP pyrophosphatase MutT (NUDIX family)
MTDEEVCKTTIERYVTLKRTYPFDHLPIHTVHYNPHRQRHIMSYGIIAYCRSTGRFLLVKRRYSPNYLTFMRGAYRRSNMRRLIMGMCNDELKIIRRVIYRQINIHDLLKIVCPGGDNEYSAMRFDNHENDILKLLNITQSDKNIPEEAEWLFPKGRPDKSELPIDTAYREFKEETGVNADGNVPINQWPIVDHYKADNDFIYETKYWIVVFEDECEIPAKFQSYEVSAREWKTRVEVEELTRGSQRNIFQEASNQILKNDKLNTALVKLKTNRTEHASDNRNQAYH